jgi:hypothetical protein
MKKEISIKEFADELVSRIDNAKTIDCCKVEIKLLAEMAKKKMGQERITVEWKD